MIQTFIREQSQQQPTLPPAVKLSTPSCEDGGKQFYLTLSERANNQAHCGSCGTRFPTKNGAERTILPKHHIPVAVHDYRKKLEADGVRLD